MVDLPQPDGPTIERKLRFSIWQEKLSKTVSAWPLDLNILLTPRSWMIGCADVSCGRWIACSEGAFVERVSIVITRELCCIGQGVVSGQFCQEPVANTRPPPVVRNKSP